MVQERAEREFPLTHVLALADGQAWNLRASVGASSWLREFARILRLPEGFREGIPNITFVRGAVGSDWFGQPASPPETHHLCSLREDGWHARFLGVMRLWSQAQSADLVCELLNTSTRSLEILMMGQSLHPIFEAALNLGGIPLHAGLVELQGRGVLLAGSGGSGKSTCCRRLPSPWRVLGDDETLLSHTSPGMYTAHPLPTWNDLLVRDLDHTWNLCAHVPLHAILYVVQSAHDSIEPVGRGEAATRICQSSEQVCVTQMQSMSESVLRTWRQRTFASACNVATAVPTFVLRVSRRGEFWRHMESVLASLAAGDSCVHAGCSPVCTHSIGCPKALPRDHLV